MAAQTKFERRALFLATACTVLAFIFEIVAICTNNWLVLTIPEGAYQNASGNYLVEAFSGLWRLCRVEVSRHVKEGGKTVETRRVDACNNYLKLITEHMSIHVPGLSQTLVLEVCSTSQSDEACTSHNLFPTEEESRLNTAIDNHYLDGPNELVKIDYTRTAIAFTIIGICLMAIGHVFAVYTLRHPRYIYKRLTALLHFMTAACILVLNEVFSRSVEREMQATPNEYPQGTKSSYGFSYALSWIVFVQYVVAGCIFLFLSHKRKAEMADTVDVMAEHDEPLQLGRV